MKRLFVPPQTLTRNGEDLSSADLSSADHHHVTRVLRLQVDDQLELADGSGSLVRARIVDIGPKRTRLKLLERLNPPPLPPPRLRLLFGVARGARTDFVLQKATELGVNELCPLICERSVARPKDALRKQERWQEIVRQASRQSRRLQAPSVAAPQPFSEGVADDSSPQKLVASPDGASSLQLLRWERPPPEISLLVGPEGGLTAAELDLSRQRGFGPVCLGPLILRTETATTALLALINHSTSRWDP